MSREQKIDLLKLKELVEKSDSYSELNRLLDWPVNGSSNIKLKKIILDNNIDISHFSRMKSRIIKYPKKAKICPVCGKEFIERIGSPREKKTCSHSCSNTFFKSGVNHPNWSDSSYRSTCFVVHEKKCVVCGEEKVIEVHHFDKNKANNSVGNLIPLCPTHHKYCHSKYYFEILEILEEYRKQFIETDIKES